MTDCMDELEAAPGLPEQLPPGEKVLWRGSPEWRMLARNTFHLPLLAGYFLLLLTIRGAMAIWSGAEISAVLQNLAVLAVPGLAVGGLFALGAWLIAQTTIYTVTSRRLVMRFGLALPLNINLPFSRIQAASVRYYADGFGDIPLSLDQSHRASYIVLWPHVRPWQFRRPEPMLRGIGNARAVAEIIARTASSNRPAATESSSSPADTAGERETAGPAAAVMGAAG